MLYNHFNCQLSDFLEGQYYSFRNFCSAKLTNFKVSNTRSFQEVFFIIETVAWLLTTISYSEADSIIAD